MKCNGFSVPLKNWEPIDWRSTNGQKCLQRPVTLDLWSNLEKQKGLGGKWDFLWISFSLRNSLPTLRLFPVPYYFNNTSLSLYFSLSKWLNQVTPAKCKMFFGLILVCLATFPISSLFVYRIYSRYSLLLLLLLLAYGLSVCVTECSHGKVYNFIYVLPQPLAVSLCPCRI